MAVKKNLDLGSSIVLASSVLNFGDQLKQIEALKGKARQELVCATFVRNHRINEQSEGLMEKIKEETLGYVLQSTDKKIVVVTEGQLRFLLGTYPSKTSSKAKGDPFLTPADILKKNLAGVDAAFLAKVSTIDPKKLQLQVDAGNISQRTADAMKNPDYVPGVASEIDKLTCTQVKSEVEDPHKPLVGAK